MEPLSLSFSSHFPTPKGSGKSISYGYILYSNGFLYRSDDPAMLDIVTQLTAAVCPALQQMIWGLRFISSVVG
jgi:hypothetical protein